MFETQEVPPIPENEQRQEKHISLMASVDRLVKMSAKLGELKDRIEGVSAAPEPKEDVLHTEPSLFLTLDMAPKIINSRTDYIRKTIEEITVLLF